MGYMKSIPEDYPVPRHQRTCWLGYEFSGWVLALGSLNGYNMHFCQWSKILMAILGLKHVLSFAKCLSGRYFA